MRKHIIFISFVLFMSACSSVLITGRKQLLLVSNSEVLSMSAVSYKQFVDSVPMSTDNKNVTLVKAVGENISASVIDYMNSNGLAEETTNYAWEFNLVQDTTVNAFCMPGGKVVVYEGILGKTLTEAGLAVVMGHEIAHAVAKHSNERLTQQMIASYGAGLTDMLLANRSEATRQSISILYGIGAQVGMILPYSRKHEYEADRLGLIFMAMAGYDPNEAISFWERMSADNTGSSLEFMSTHPSDAKRIVKMKEVLPEALKYYKK